MIKRGMFYSYKGGAGKTTAMLNVAAYLVDAGHKVGVVDVDFEAPGLGALYNIDTSNRDLLILLAKCLPIAEVEAHIAEITMPSGKPVLCLPCSGNDELLDEIKWGDGKTLRYFNEVLKAFESTFSLDYLFLDVRSGISTQAACVIQYADCVIIACRLDKQSRKGVSLLRALCRARNMPYKIVANAVPMSNGKLNMSMKTFKSEVGEEPNILIPYESDLYFEECIVVGVEEFADSSISEAYRKLAKSIESAG